MNRQAESGSNRIINTKYLLNICSILTSERFQLNNKAGGARGEGGRND